jgi:hypothetical protein
MKRQEAENLIGKMVITGLINGTRYYGELIEIIPNKPFRAIIKVKGIYEYTSVCVEYNDNKLEYNSFFIEGSLVETGNGIQIFKEQIQPYKQSLIEALKRYNHDITLLIEFKGYKEENVFMKRLSERLKESNDLINMLS